MPKSPEADTDPPAIVILLPVCVIVTSPLSKLITPPSAKNKSDHCSVVVPKAVPLLVPGDKLFSANSTSLALLA